MTSISINNWMYKENMTHAYNKIMFRRQRAEAGGILYYAKTQQNLEDSVLGEVGQGAGAVA